MAIMGLCASGEVQGKEPGIRVNGEGLSRVDKILINERKVRRAPVLSLEGSSIYQRRKLAWQPVQELTQVD